MSIASEIQRLQTAKENIKAAIESKGVTVPSSLKIDGYAQIIIDNLIIDPYAGHEYVDLGLPSGTKWAKYNVGANTETDYGNFYQYGKGADQYAATSGESVYSGIEDPLSFSVDTARQTWGGFWHMPTKTQLEELTANTTYEWTTINGVNGGKFTASNGNYIFIPAAGLWDSGSHKVEGSYGYFWSSSPRDSYYSFILYFSNRGPVVNGSHRKSGFSVRPVVG